MAYINGQEVNDAIIVKSVAGGEIADGSVTTAKLADEAVTEQKLSSEVQAKLNASSADNSFSGKVVSILGDSISTFAGYIPVADGHNLTHRARYPQANLLTDVELTYWKKLITNLGAKLGINDSWAGSRVSNSSSTNTGDVGPDACMASVTRITNLGSNGTPDIILFYGGTNDAGASVTVGTFDSTANYTTVDLQATMWTTFAEAYKDAIMRLQYYYPDAKIIVLLPMYTTSYYTIGNLDKYNEVIKDICDYFGVMWFDLRACGINWQNKGYTLGDGIHPTAAGMDLIEKYIRTRLLATYTLNEGENAVYTITNDLTNVTNSNAYIKGVTQGKAYTATLTANSGAITNVSIIMGGTDITATAYSSGTISISNVTGNIAITATASGDTPTPTPTEVWYHEAAEPTNKAAVNIAGRGWCYRDNVNDKLIGVPINAIKFWTSAANTNGDISISVVDKNTSEPISTTATTYNKSDSVAEEVTVIFPETITLQSGQYLAFFAQTSNNFQALYEGEGTKGEGFYSRVPKVYGTGTAWTEATKNGLAFSVGYVTSNNE